MAGSGLWTDAFRLHCRVLHCPDYVWLLVYVVIQLVR